MCALSNGLPAGVGTSAHFDPIGPMHLRPFGPNRAYAFSASVERNLGTLGEPPLPKNSAGHNACCGPLTRAQQRDYPWCMRHAMLGMGGVGGYFGAKLSQSGTEVHFLVRREARNLRERGLRIISSICPMHIAPLHVYDQVEDMPSCDIVWVALKTVDNARLQMLLPPLVGPRTLVIMLQNGLDPESDAAQVVGAEHVAGGACLLMAAKTGLGEITHWGEGSITLGHHLKHPVGWAEAQLAAAQQALVRANVGVALCSDLPSTRWRKLVWNVPFNGLSALLGANTHALVRSPAACAQARILMQEVMAVAAACGSPQDASLIETMVTFTKMLPDYATSMKWDVERGHPLEVDALFERPIAVAQALGVQVPAMAFLRDALRFLSGG